MFKKVSTIIVLSLLLFLSINPLLGSAETSAKASETIYVDDDNTSGPWDGTTEHPYQHIQDALNASSDGDTVFVFNGTYTELVTIATEVTLIGENNSATILQDIIRDGYSTPELLTISADNVVVKNLYLREHNNTNFHHTIFGIYCTGSDGVRIQQNRFVNCSLAIWLEHCSAEISDNIIFYGYSLGLGAIRFEEPTLGSELIVSNNTIINYTYGISFECFNSGPSRMLIDYNTIESSCDGWGISVFYTANQNYQMRISHNVITGFLAGLNYNYYDYELFSNRDNCLVEILSNSFNNTENDLLLYPTSRWSDETITITKNNFFGQNNNELFLDILTLDPSCLPNMSMLHKTSIEWDNNYWAGHSTHRPVWISGRMVVWLSYTFPLTILRIPIFQKDRNPASEPFEIET